MTREQAALIDFCNHLLKTLKEFEQSYLSGENGTHEALAHFRKKRPNLERTQKLAAKYMDMPPFAQICSDFPRTAPKLLHLIQPDKIRFNWLEDAIQAAQNLKDQQAHAIHLGNKGELFIARGNIKQGIRDITNALKLFKAPEDLSRIGNAHGRLGTAYAILNDPQRARHHFQKAIKIARQVKNKHQEAADLGNLGHLFLLTQQYRRAIVILHAAISKAQALNNISLETKHLCVLGQTYEAMHQIPKARSYYLRALWLNRDIRDDDVKTSVYGNLAQLFFKTKQFSLAERYFRKTLRHTSHLLDIRRQAMALVSLGQVRLMLRDIITAEECFNDALHLVLETEHVEIIKDARKGLSYIQHIRQAEQTQ